MNRYAWAIVCLLGAAACADPTAAQSPSNATRPGEAATQPADRPTTLPLSDATRQRLAELDARIALVRDMTTRFRQEKHTTLTRKPIVSTGTIRVKGSVILWETEKPAPSVMRIDQEELRVYYPREKTVEIYRLDQQMAKMAASPLPRLELLREHFEISEPPRQPADAATLLLELVPRQASLRQHVAAISVTLDLKGGHMRTMTMTDPDGERTQLSFEEVRMNRGLDDDDLKLKIPGDAKTVRPLEAMEAVQTP